MSDPNLAPPSPYQPITPGSAPAGASPYGVPAYSATGTASYGQAPGQVPGQPYYWSTKPPTNSVAIVALILAFVVPLGGIIAGHIALSQIKRTGEGGRGMALGGTIIGYVFTGFGVLYIGAMIALYATMAVSTSYYG